MAGVAGAGRGDGQQNDKTTSKNQQTSKHNTRKTTKTNNNQQRSKQNKHKTNKQLDEATGTLLAAGPPEPGQAVLRMRQDLAGLEEVLLLRLTYIYIYIYTHMYCYYHYYDYDYDYYYYYSLCYYHCQ